MFASVEIGRVMYSYNTLTHAVKSGSRHLSQVILNPAMVIELSEQKLSETRSLVVTGNPHGTGSPRLPGFEMQDVTVSVVHPTIAMRRYVEVRATYDYRSLFGSIPGFGTGDGHDFGLSLNATSTMRILR